MTTILATLLLIAAGTGTGPQTMASAQPQHAYRAFVPGLATAGLTFTVDFIDVGQGDATLVSVGERNLLVDGGRSASRIRTRLEALGVTGLDAILATHSDADHIAGLSEALALYDVQHVYLNGDVSRSATYAGLHEAIASEGSSVTTLRRGDAVYLDGFRIDVLHPPELTGDLNRDSIVLALQCGDVGLLLMGDATIASEESMLGAETVPDVDVLKLGHHGSDTSTSQQFLDATTPSHALVSAGRTNGYGHPHVSVIERVEAAGVEVVRTDTTAGDDTVTMTSDCQTYSLE